MREECDSFVIEPCKNEVNRVLFQYMPPNTTLREAVRLWAEVERLREKLAIEESARAALERKDGT